MVIFKHNKVLLQRIRREYFNNCLWYQVNGRYFEQKSFQEALLFYIFNIIELNPTNKVASMIHQLLKSLMFKKNPNIVVGSINKFGIKFFQFSGKIIKLSGVRARKN